MHLLVDISAHGFGHVAQTAAVVNALARRVPGLALTVRSAAPARLLAQRFHVPFTHVPVELDFGILMASAVEVRADATCAAYAALHGRWPERVAEAAAAMAALAPDRVLANAPYLSLAAAARLGVPAVGMCSLNWADLYRHVCRDAPGAGRIHGEILAAYEGAARFLRLAPGMPMPDFTRALDVGPVAEPGRARRAELAAALGLAPGERVALVAMGGLEHRLPVEDWPAMPGVRWLVPAAWGVARPGFGTLDVPGFLFADLLASSDAVLTKPGYGTFLEAACTGVPVLYVPRDDWPEAPPLCVWLERHAVARRVGVEVAARGELAGVLEAVWNAPPRPPVVPTGVEEAVAFLAGWLAA